MYSLGFFFFFSFYLCASGLIGGSYDDIREEKGRLSCSKPGWTVHYYLEVLL